MVFKTKAPVAAKNFQAKKGKGKKAQVEQDEGSDMFEVLESDDDDSGDSEEEMQVQTPIGKQPKGKLSLSEKKVSFQVPNKTTTPGKTPNSSAKKPATPGSKGKRSLKEFKGINSQAKVEEDEDDDDDLDDDDDDDDDLSDDLDIDMGDDDDDDDEDEDDNDEEDEEEVQQSPVKKPTTPKQKNKTETPAKQAVKGQTPKKDLKMDKSTPKKDMKNEKPSPKETSKLQQHTNTEELQRRKERDYKMLYVGNLPKDVTVEDLKSLSSEIIECIIPTSNRSKSSKTSYAFLQFASESKAEANLKTLQAKKFKGQPFAVDFVGEKSLNKKTSNDAMAEQQYNMKRLYVSGIPLSATIAQVAKFFPKAIQVTFNHSPLFRSATINFMTVEEADEAFSGTKDVEITGQQLTVLHSLQSNGQAKKRKRNVRKNKGNKRMKTQKDDSDSE